MREYRINVVVAATAKMNRDRALDIIKERLRENTITHLIAQNLHLREDFDTYIKEENDIIELVAPKLLAEINKSSRLFGSYVVFWDKGEILSQEEFNEHYL